MEYGVHLPLADLGGGFSLPALKDYARAASELGYSYLCANDHLVFARPWLDGLTALAAVIDQSGEMTLATTVSLPVIRGPAPLAKALTAIDVLSMGRLIAGVGPGSSPVDYALAGVPFEDRWRRFDETLTALAHPAPFTTPGRGTTSPAEGRWSPAHPRQEEPGLGRELGQSPRPAQGRALGDGWIASAYNVTPEGFGRCLSTLRRVRGRRRAAASQRSATMWTYVSEDAADAERMLTDTLAPMLNRPVESLRHLPIGPAEVCARRLGDFASEGVERGFLWPLADPVRQLELIRETGDPAGRCTDGSDRRGPRHPPCGGERPPADGTSGDSRGRWRGDRRSGRRAPCVAASLDALADLVAEGDVVVLSGAGLSTDSGIPDYRGATGSLRRHTR
jgi:alkanesulfonate monooxygenase SsuD/methylene tetrahydromethanopterin reductase-like flavin-dependent oxidoreductase (luciferase family)